jgi:hypothetical protein
MAPWEDLTLVLLAVHLRQNMKAGVTDRLWYRTGQGWISHR